VKFILIKVRHHKFQKNKLVDGLAVGEVHLDDIVEMFAYRGHAPCHYMRKICRSSRPDLMGVRPGSPHRPPDFLGLKKFVLALYSIHFTL
jgi:hypothetical protein